ncbi:MAG: ABC transporter, partial [Planctomycetota bacterium]|nr:ABC transporter [Planctomycetota bacterium]
AIILTSHYMEDIERLCKRIVIIDDGGFIYDGPLAEISNTYANQKIVTAHLTRDGSGRTDRAALEEFGQLLEADDTQLRLCVSRDQVAAASAYILDQHDVADLSIEQEDIGTVIERIFAERRQERS